MLEIEFKTQDYYVYIPKDFTGIVKYTQSKIYKEYYLNGLKHREDGPAVYKKSSWGSRIFYYLNGVSYFKDKWFEQLTIEQQIKALMNPENF